VNYSGADSRSWRVQSRSPLEHRTLSGGAPDSPVNYSEAPLKIPEGAKFGLESPGAPDSPVNYSGAPLSFPEGEEFGLEFPGAPDTVRCARPGHTSVIPYSLC
jgi:hypothetical protein